MTLLGGFHDAANQTIVFSVHYLRAKGTAESVTVPAQGVYLLLNGTKYPIELSDTVQCDSQTGAYNVIDEYIVRGYKVLGASQEIPGLRTKKSVIFGLDYSVNGKPIKIEKEVPIFKMKKTR